MPSHMSKGLVLYPYPILNSKRALSTYKPWCNFNFHFSCATKGERVLLNDVYCTLDCTYLKKLIKQNKAEMILLVQCPQTMYRQCFSLLTVPQDFEIHSAMIANELELTAYIIAKEDIIIDKFDDEFADEYADLLPINIEKHCSLAVSDNQSAIIQFDVPDDLKRTPIFKVAVDHNLSEGEIRYSYLSDTIIVYVDEKTQKKYETFRKEKDLLQYYMSLLAVPALMYSVQSLLIDTEDTKVESIECDYKWYVAFCKTFREKYKHEFCSDDIPNLSKNIQDIFDYPIGKSLFGIDKLLKKGGSDHAEN